MIYAYIKESGSRQDTSKKTKLIYARTELLGGADFKTYKDSVGHKLTWPKRLIGEVINALAKGDILITTEMPEVAKTTLEALEIIKAILDKGAILHIINDDKVIGDNPIEDKAYLQMLEHITDIERNFIKNRAKESLAKRKQEISEKGYYTTKQGKKKTTLGRPVGTTTAPKLNAKANKVHSMIANGDSKTAIAIACNVSRPTLDAWLEKNTDKSQPQLDLSN